MSLKQLVDIVAKPGIVTELECKLSHFSEFGEEVREALRVFPHVGRQLNQYRAKLFFQIGCRCEEKVHLLIDFSETPDVCNLLAQLEGE